MKRNDFVGDSGVVERGTTLVPKKTRSHVVRLVTIEVGADGTAELLASPRAYARTACSSH